MSTERRTQRLTVPDFSSRKGGQPLVCITAYTAPMARLLDPHVDLLMVGDSLGMVLYGFESTLPVTLEMMIAHGGAVVRGSRQSLVVVDMPFGSYQESPAQAYRAAARVLAESGAQAVKLEGGVEMAETVAFLVARGVPVMGHVGLTPQSVNVFGGYKRRGRGATQHRMILEDAKAIDAAGAFSIVIEGVVEPLGREVTASVAAPVIGIGASPACDGQVLVAEDLLGIFDAFRPKFVKRYAEIGGAIGDAVQRYAAEVRARQFPGPEHCVVPKEGS